MHGFTFALAWGGGSAYCAQLSPPGLEASTQGLFQGAPWGGTAGRAGCGRRAGTQAAPPCLVTVPPSHPPPRLAGLYFGAGVGAGTLVGGSVYSHLGARNVYLVACAVLAGGWALTSMAQLAVRLAGERSGAAAQPATPVSPSKYLQLELTDVLERHDS